MQQRCFHRVLFTAKGVVAFNDEIFKGHIENISLNGALISLETDITVNHGDKCFMTIYPDGESQPIRIIAEVVRFLRNTVGVKFIAIDDETRSCLFELVNRITTEPKNMAAENEKLKKFFVNYFDCSEPYKTRLR